MGSRHFFPVNSPLSGLFFHMQQQRKMGKMQMEEGRRRCSARKLYCLGDQVTWCQVTWHNSHVVPLMLENESSLAGILGGKNVGTPIWISSIRSSAIGGVPQ